MTIEIAIINFVVNSCIVLTLYYLQKKNKERFEDLETKIIKNNPTSRRKK